MIKFKSKPRRYRGVAYTSEIEGPILEQLLDKNDDVLLDVGSDIMARGKDYFQHDAVMNIQVHDHSVEADVMGTECYHTTVSIKGSDFDYTCSCPYDYDGPCKHVVALVLAYRHGVGPEENSAEISPIEVNSLKEQLKQQSKPALIKLLLKLATNSDAEAYIRKSLQKKEVNTRSASSLAGRVKAIMKETLDAQSYYPMAGSYGLIEQVEEVLEEVMSFADSIPVQKLLQQLKAITDPVINGIPRLVDSEDVAIDFLTPLMEAWTRTLLRTELKDKERKRWLDPIAKWQETLAEGEFDDQIEPAAWAALAGWADERLEGILSGKSQKRLRWEGDEDARLLLVGVLLSILEEQGRHDEQLRLAMIEGTEQHRISAHRTADQIDEAVELAITNLEDSRESLEFCKSLEAMGRVSDAICLGAAFLSKLAPASSAIMVAMAFGESSYTLDILPDDDEGVFALRAMAS